jgi:glutamate synthase (NADPH/NADH) large chain
LTGGVVVVLGETGRNFGAIDGECYFRGIAGERFAVRNSGATAVIEGAGDHCCEYMTGGVVVVLGETGRNFGAVDGECYFRGIAGERFAVRNSGATAVIEGAGDHCCEYMTGGVVVVLGETGRNFGAGMSGGIAYVLDEKDKFTDLFNPQMIELENISTGNGKGNENFYDSLLFNDSDRLKKLIESHIRFTNSEKAKNILENFEKYLPKFKKVMPIEFRKVLLENIQIKDIEKQNKKPIGK